MSSFMILKVTKIFHWNGVPEWIQKLIVKIFIWSEAFSAKRFNTKYENMILTTDSNWSLKIFQRSIANKLSLIKRLSPICWENVFLLLFFIIQFKAYNFYDNPINFKNSDQNSICKSLNFSVTDFALDILLRFGIINTILFWRYIRAI